MRIRLLLLAINFAILCNPIRPQGAISVSTVAEGLFHPVGLALLPDGAVLIAEAGNGKGEKSAGISLLRPNGNLGRLVSGFPSARIDDRLISAPAVAVSPDKTSIYMAFAGSQIYGLPSQNSRILPKTPFSPKDLTSVKAGRGRTFLLHPFDITFDTEGRGVISDAAGNGLAVATQSGEIRFFHRFAALDNPEHRGGRLEALPTGIISDGDGFYVSLFAGCPHTANAGELVKLTPDGKQHTLIDGLNMPIDVANDAEGNIWVLEFATHTLSSECFEDLDQQQPSGRLSKINAAGSLETVVANLNFPGGVLPLADGSLYVTEVYSGRLLHIQFDSDPPVPKRFPPGNFVSGETLTIADLDQALREVIKQHELSAYPGRDEKESDSAMARLGRDLFFDPILSGDKNISCATCHHPQLAMTDARVLPIGAGGHGLGDSRVFLPHVHVSSDTRNNINGEIANPFVGQFVPRNSPTVLNSALSRIQFWDGRVERYADEATVTTKEDAINELQLSDPLMVQSMFPVTSEREMAGASFGNDRPMVIRSALVKRLQQIDAYVAQFEAVFGTAEIDAVRVAEAIAAFERQLIFTESPWDDYIAGDAQALSTDQKRGALLFYGALNSKLNCAFCHSGDLLTDLSFYNLLVPQIGPGTDNGANEREDFGRANVSFDYRDQYKFRTPSLRNVGLTAPYFHNGTYRTLPDTIWHHANVWRANMVYDPLAQLPVEFQDAVLPYDFERQAHTVVPVLQEGLPINETDVADLVQFLQALTDPAARELTHLVPEVVPSGLPLDPLIN